MRSHVQVSSLKRNVCGNVTEGVVLISCHVDLGEEFSSGLELYVKSI